MPISYNMLTSVEDLIGRMVVASERKVTQSAEPDRVILALGFPYPSETTNNQLEELQPFYIQLLQNLENLEEESILNRLEASDDEAMLLLYVFEFPILVLTARKDVAGIAKCQVKEKYEIRDIAVRILSNKILLSWCRNTIANHQQHCISVLTSAVTLLSAIDPSGGILSKSKVKKHTQNIIFRGKGDKGFSILREDLAGVVSRKNVTSTLVANSILMQVHVLVNIYGEDHAITVLHRSPKKEFFERALFQVKNQLDENFFQFLRVTIGCATTQKDIFQAASLPYQNRDSIESVFICGKEGCSNAGSRRCARCKLVGYCSKDCQTTSWKKHKKICKPSKPDSKKINTAVEAARQAPDPALRKQDYLLSKNPSFDYVIVMPDGNKDFGVQMDHPMGKMMFNFLRQIAPNTPAAVYRMYGFLKSIHPGMEDIIRGQLMAEYGIDPLSDIAKNGQMPEMSKEDMRSMF